MYIWQLVTFRTLYLIFSSTVSTIRGRILLIMVVSKRHTTRTKLGLSGIKKNLAFPDLTILRIRCSGWAQRTAGVQNTDLSRWRCAFWPVTTPRVCSEWLARWATLKSSPKTSAAPRAPKWTPRTNAKSGDLQELVIL